MNPRPGIQRRPGPLRFAIIGAGASGTAVLHQLAALAMRCSDPSAFGVTVYERDEVPGPGLPYGRQCLASHLNNMESEEMSVDPERAHDFADWLQAHEDSAQAFPDADRSRRGFAPRQLFGIYLQERFRSAVGRLRDLGAAVDVRRDEVIDLDLADRRIELRGRTTGPDRFDKAVLAIGHWQPPPPAHLRGLHDRLWRSGAGGYLSPWPARGLIERCAGAQRVVILGTSLTAVDAILSIAGATGSWVARPDGGLRYSGAGCPPIVAASRHGFLPRVRPSAPDAIAQIDVPACGSADLPGFERAFWEVARRRGASGGRPFYEPYEGTEDADVTGLCLDLLGEDLRRLAAGDPAWHRDRATLRAMYRFVASCYAALPPREMLRFLADFFPSYNSLVAAVPEATSRKIVALLEAGVLSVRRGVGQIEADEARGCFRLDCGSTKLAARHVVDAIGRHRCIANHPSELVQALLGKRIVSPHPAGGIRVEETSSAVIDAGGRISSRLFALGDLTLGQRLGTSATIANAKFAHRMVDVWSEMVS